MKSNLAPRFRGANGGDRVRPPNTRTKVVRRPADREISGDSFAGGIVRMENEMRSTLINERVLGGRGSLAGNVPDAKSKFKVGLARINQELWLVLSLFVIAGLFNW